MLGKTIAAGGLAAAGVLAARTFDRYRKNRAVSGDPARWRSVTVNLPPDRIAPGGKYPAPLAELGDQVEIRVVAAPGGWGSELSARPLGGATRGRAAVSADSEERVPEDPVEAVRRALRQAKSLLETGEVLVNSPRPHGVRPRSVLGGVVDGWEKRAQGKGLL